VYNDKTGPKNPDNKVTTISNMDAFEHFFTFDSVNFVVSWNKLYKTELFKGIRYPIGKTREDEFTTYKLIYKSKRIAITEKVMYYYFLNENSIMHDQSLKKELDFADAMENRIVFFIDNNQCELYKKTLKRYCLWLICTAYMFQKKRQNEPEFYHNLQERRKKYIDRLLAEYRLPKFSQLVYRFAKKEPFFPGFFAFHKLYRYDFLSKLAGIMFEDKQSLIPQIKGIQA